MTLTKREVVEHERACDECGYSLRYLPVAPLLRCPECGTLSPLKSPPNGPTDGSMISLAICVSLFAMFAIGFLMPAIAHSGSTPEGREACKILSFVLAMDTYAEETGSNVQHPATLILEQYVSPDMFVDELLPSQRGRRRVAWYDITSFDYTERHVASLNSAIAVAANGGLKMRVCDRWFARWPPWCVLGDTLVDPAALIIWSPPHADGSRIAAFADGHDEYIGKSHWPAVRAAHLSVLRKAWASAESAPSAFRSSTGP